MASKIKKGKANTHLFTVIIIAVILLVIGFLCRMQLQRGITAYEIYHKHIFISPLNNSNESRIKQLENNTQFYWDIAGLRIAQRKRVKQFNPVIKPLIKEIIRRQALGEGMQYSMNIYREIRWRLNFTKDTVSTRMKISELRKSLSQLSLQKTGNLQQPSDGSWGAGIGVWYLRMYYSIDHVVHGKDPVYPYTFLDRINSPEKLKQHLEGVLYNDFTKTGVFNREELDETFSGITRLLKKKKIAYTFHPKLDSTILEFVKHWQNPVSGCWGQWLIDRHGRIWKMDDMGITFHVISDLHGQVEHKDLIAKRLLELKNVDFPTGIRFDGDYNNHLNWDAVKIFRYAWPTLDSDTREKVRTEISKMQTWCLTKSYQPDGSFKTSDLDDTLGDAYSYGVYFLNETGYFDSKKRFWTNQSFPEAKKVHIRIKSKILSIGLNDPGLKDAFDSLTEE